MADHGRRRAAARRHARRAGSSRARGELLAAAELIRDAINPIMLAGNGVVARRRRAGAARARARDRDRRRRDVHGQGRARLRGPARARHRRAAVARLRARGLRGRRRRDHGRLRPRRALAGELEPEARQEDRLHRQRRRPRSTSTSSPRSTSSATSTTSSAAWPRSCAHAPRTTRALAAGRHRARPLRGGQGRRRLPDAAAARAVGDPPGARPPRHADLRRRPAQAVDRAHVPGARAQHGADRQRPGRDGHRAADARSRPSSCTRTATWSRSTATAAS